MTATCFAAFAAWDVVSIAAYAFNDDICNLCANRTCQRDDIGKCGLTFADSNTKIYLFAKDIKVKTDNLCCTVTAFTGPNVLSLHCFRRIISHYIASNPPVNTSGKHLLPEFNKSVSSIVSLMLTMLSTTPGSTLTVNCGIWRIIPDM
jgi:hypothetical protein